MKKLLLLGMSLVFSTGIMLPAVPKQSILCTSHAHTAEILDTEKLAQIESISSDTRSGFCESMIRLPGNLATEKMISFMDNKRIPINPLTLLAYQLITKSFSLGTRIISRTNDSRNNITQSAVQKLVNSHFNDTDGITAVDNSLVIELLKEHKNRLVEEINAEVIKQATADSFGIGDSLTEDYAEALYMSLFYAAGIQYTLHKSPRIIQEARFAQGVLCAISANALHKLGKCYYYIRSREAKMNIIDALIKQIQEFETAEKA